MKNIKGLLDRRPFIIVMFFCVLVGIWSLFSKWQLVDDGKSAQIAYQLTTSLKSFDLNTFWKSLLEPESGRFRPGYWIFLWLTFLLGGLNPTIHYLIHFSIFVSSAWFIYKLVILSGGRKYFAAFSSLLFVVDWRLLENWYRLGPQEPIQTLLLLISVYLYFKFRKGHKVKNFTISVLCAVFALMIKETNIAYVGIAFYIAIVDVISGEKVKSGLVYLLIIIFFGIVFRGISALNYPISGYGSLYSIDLDSILVNLASYLKMIRDGYGPMLYLVLLYFLFSLLANLRLFRIRKLIKINYFDGLFLIWFVSFFVILLPWGFTIGRYLLTALAGLFIFIGLMLDRIFYIVDNLTKNKNKKEELSLYFLYYLVNKGIKLYLIILVFYQVSMSLSYVNHVLKVSEFNDLFVKELVSKTPRYGVVYLDTPKPTNEPLELFEEMKWHFQYLYYRSDIKLQYLPENYTPNYGDIICVHTVKPLITSDQLERQYNTNLIKGYSINSYNLVLAGPTRLIKDILLDLTSTITHTKHDGSYFTFTDYKYKWDIYTVNNL